MPTREAQAVADPEHIKRPSRTLRRVAMKCPRCGYPSIYQGPHVAECGVCGWSSP